MKGLAAVGAAARSDCCNLCGQPHNEGSDCPCVGSPIMKGLTAVTCVGSPIMKVLTAVTCVGSPIMKGLTAVTCVGSPIMKGLAAVGAAP